MTGPKFSIIGNHRIPIKAWNKGVPFEEEAIEQTRKVASMPFVRGIALMPDCHVGYGCTVGSVIASEGAICPSIVGVDIGCGMFARRTDYNYEEIRERSKEIYDAIYRAIPTGRTNNGGEGDRGAWGDIPENIKETWNLEFESDYEKLCQDYPGAKSRNAEKQLGTLGTGNHFIEICTEADPPHKNIWIVLHSGSRGLGNRIGSYFTSLAKEMCNSWYINLPDPDLAYFPIGTEEYYDYINALRIAQRFAWFNRSLMMNKVFYAMESLDLVARGYEEGLNQVHCHHNYMEIEEHRGKQLIITRKGAVRAREGDYAVIPGSMGARTYIAMGLGSEHSYTSCSHGAGRQMGRKVAQKTITLEQHIAATQGVECCKTEDVIDESPAAYKDIDAVMEAQSDLVKPILALKQIICVKGLGDSQRRQK